MKNILVPCDFSKPSREAFKMAVDIASRSNGVITVLYTILIPVIVPDVNVMGDPFIITHPYYNSLQEDAQKSFAEMQKELGKNTKCNFQMTTGGLVESINRISSEKEIDLVVMGTHGSSGTEEVLVGSNTEKTVRFSKVPVLAVRKSKPFQHLKNILLPTTGDLDQVDFVSRVKELQAFFGAKLHVLLVNSPATFMRDAEGKEALLEFVKHYQLNDYELHFKSYRHEAEGIIDFAHVHKMDLIAMATHSRKGLAHLFSGSITEDVVNHFDALVWTYTIEKR
jgi:nucleotide-binding universal stress UspA family protein